MAVFIDSHAHIDAAEFDTDRAEVLARARAAGVTGIIVVGAADNLQTAERTVTLAESEPNVWATVGVHPHNASSLQDDWWPHLRVLAQRPSVVAIGETGLDYHYDLSPRDVQQRHFAAFVEMGVEVCKPIVCHVRDAHEDARDILRQTGASQVGAIIHCFTGTVADAKAYVELGFYISFSGIVTFKNAEELRAAAKAVPLDRILVETDCPYLAPVPVRGKRNEPAFVVHTAAVVAEAAGVSLDELSIATISNTCKAFKLPASIESFTS